MAENVNGLKLLDNAVIFLSGIIDTEKAERICKEVISLNIEQKHPFIQFIINSHGGYCSSGFAIIDIMEWSKLPIYTTGIGMVGSMGLMVFIAGEKGKRILTPRTSILSHRYSGGHSGNHSQIVAARIEEDFMHKRIITHYTQHSGLKTEDELNKHLLRDVDTWLTPEKAVSFGLADLIETDKKNPVPKFKKKTNG
ncbi:MAG: ATP-dependent Clp protease proteolytic subunit [Candidatus Firestonebacteria bacterium]